MGQLAGSRAGAILSECVTQWRRAMAARASWKGYLRLSLVPCPVALYPATGDQEKVHFHRIDKKPGNRVHVQNVDAKTGEFIDKDDLGRGYETSKGHIVPIEVEELEA